MDMTLTEIRLPVAINGADLPEEDGRPMGETQFHVIAILHLYAALDQFFEAIEDIYVSADMLLYYDQDAPAKYVVPDVFVVKGVAKHVRRIYKLWEEKLAPQVVFEISSRSTRWQDKGSKLGLYQEMGVNEYFIFDPLDEYLQPALQGFRRVGATLEPIQANADGSIASQELGLILRSEQTLLRLVNPKTGEPLLTLSEAMALAEQETERAQAEAERAEMEAERAQVEAARAQAEAARAQVEAARADRAEAETDRLRRELERLRKQRDG
jgi:Uma2 family endonuclease